MQPSGRHLEALSRLWGRILHRCRGPERPRFLCRAGAHFRSHRPPDRPVNAGGAALARGSARSDGQHNSEHASGRPLAVPALSVIGLVLAQLQCSLRKGRLFGWGPFFWPRPSPRSRAPFGAPLAPSTLSCHISSSLPSLPSAPPRSSASAAPWRWWSTCSGPPALPGREISSSLRK